jgi:hypothetical protein
MDGVLQVDGYAADKKLTDEQRAGGPVMLAYCWSHLRRKFYEIAAGGNAPIAAAALMRIGRLYEIEAEIRGSMPETRRAARQAWSEPVVDAFKPWLEEISKGRPSPRRSAMGSSTGTASAASLTTGVSRSIPTPSSAPSPHRAQPHEGAGADVRTAAAAVKVRSANRLH